MNKTQILQLMQSTAAAMNAADLAPDDGKVSFRIPVRGHLTVTIDVHESDHMELGTGIASVLMLACISVLSEIGVTADRKQLAKMQRMVQAIGRACQAASEANE
jgi:transketolase C-terminal domain/subunit